MFPASFTAIDFETASRRPDSACQLGLVKVVQGSIVEQCCWLIRPIPFHFHPSNIRIHGITPDQVKHEPEFSQIWDEIMGKIGDSCLVAHNASFDMRVLIATLRTQKLAIPEFQYTCTRAIAKKTWPHQRRFGLKPLSNWLGIRFQHHDALEDAMACAKLLIAAGIDQESESLSDLEQKLRLKRGHAGSWGMKGPITQKTKSQRNRGSTKTKNSFPFIKPSDLPGITSSKKKSEPVESWHDPFHSKSQNLQRLMIRIEFIRPLVDKKIYIEGKLKLEVSEIRQLVLAAGAILQDEINNSTQFIIQDQPSPYPFSTGQPSLNQSDRQVLSSDRLVELLQSCANS